MSRDAVVCLYRDGERKLQTWVDMHRNLLMSTGICGRLSYRYHICHGNWNRRAIHLLFFEKKTNWISPNDVFHSNSERVALSECLWWSLAWTLNRFDTNIADDYNLPPSAELKLMAKGLAYACLLLAEHIGGNKSCFLTTTALDNFYILGTEEFVALLVIDITN